MKLVFFLTFLFIFTLSFTTFSQSKAETGEPATFEINRATRNPLIKADILKDIQTMNAKDQAYFYVQLGNTFWKQDKTEANVWIKKGVEIGINPSTEYKNEAEKLTILWSLLSYVLQKDEILSNKLISKIKEIKIDESNNENLKQANQTYIKIAEQILSRKKDKELAFYFAMLSLNGKKPAVNSEALQYFWKAMETDETLANDYFGKLYEAVKKNGGLDLAFFIIYFFGDNFIENSKKFKSSDSLTKTALEYYLPFIQNEYEKLLQKKLNSCRTTAVEGTKYLPEYIRLLPEKAGIVQQAITLCQNSEIENWRKPEFYLRPRKTSQDYLELAKEITDRKTKTDYLYNAAQRAEREKKYRLAIEILDVFFEDLHWSGWYLVKQQATAGLIAELFNKGEFSEINRLANSMSEKYRPYIILHSFWSINERLAKREQFALNLLNQARADFNKIDSFSTDADLFTFNPTRFAELTKAYVKFGYYDEAIAVHEESVRSFNRLVVNLPDKFKEKNYIPRVASYSNFTNQFPPNDVEFFDKYFERIYENIGNITDTRTRLSERLGILNKNLEKVPNSPLIPGFRSNPTSTPVYIPRVQNNKN